MTTIKMSLGERSYNITAGSGLLSMANQFFNFDRKIFIITDSGVPSEYSQSVRETARDAKIYTVPEGEGSKSLSVLEEVLLAMMEFGMTRGDAVVAVGGGVIGDLAGFAASVYMRGIDFYNIPTTLLAQVDSSIGGKTAVNLGGTKNIAGAFYQPKGVLIDTDVLKTLPKRLYSAGLAEAVKMALTFDEELFEFFENEEINEKNIQKIIEKSLLIKKAVVENDEKEAGLRKVLNFGHTLGHGIEAESRGEGLYHGECVALGMLAVCSADVKARLIGVLRKLGLPTEYNGNIDNALSFVSHDKKAKNDGIDVVLVREIGTFKIEKMTQEDFAALVKENF